MKKILVLVVKYPDNSGGVGLMYVHVRNKYYVKHGIDVTVLNFSANEDYFIDGIKVISLESFKKCSDSFDVLVLHAANIRNHYRFLKEFEKNFKHLIFFYHGHEVLKVNKEYPAPYDYTQKNNFLSRNLRNLYDDYKLRMWHKYLPTIASKSDFIFVSDWLFQRFESYVKLDEENLNNHIHIINNSIGSVFEEKSYGFHSEKKYDFITIRNMLDDSKYCIDLIDALARKYSQYKFLIIGRGKYFKINKAPQNITWLDKFLSHEEMLTYVNESKCGLLLTREDTQGVMACELATYGLPLITSDIDVCHEMFDDFGNVEMISNDIDSVDLSEVYNRLLSKDQFCKPEKFSYKNTVKKEEEIILNC